MTTITPDQVLGSAEVTPELMRAAMGAFCSGAVVVTAHGGEPLGFTCRSSASLEAGWQGAR